MSTSQRPDRIPNTHASMLTHIRGDHVVCRLRNVGRDLVPHHVATGCAHRPRVTGDIGNLLASHCVQGRKLVQVELARSLVRRPCGGVECHPPLLRRKAVQRVDQHAQQRPKGGSASCNTHFARDDAIGSQHKKPMEGRQNSRSCRIKSTTCLLSTTAKPCDATVTEPHHANPLRAILSRLCQKPSVPPTCGENES